MKCVLFDRNAGHALFLRRGYDQVRQKVALGAVPNVPLEGFTRFRADQFAIVLPDRVLYEPELPYRPCQSGRL